MVEQFGVVAWYRHETNIAKGRGARIALGRYSSGNVARQIANKHSTAPAQVARATKRRERMMRKYGRPGTHA